MELAIFTLAVYFLMSILSLVRAVVSNDFLMSYGGVGLTELRFSFSILNLLMFFFPPKPVHIGSLSFYYPELFALAWIIGMLIAYFVSFRSGLRHLSTEVP